MGTLLNKYNQIFESHKWLYYSNGSLGNNPFKSNSNVKGFIYDYFRLGGKESVFDKELSSDKMRDIHSISTFFLGFHLKDLLLIDENDYKPKFNYLWFIICLYHDYGYSIENDRDKYPPNKFTLARLIKDKTIDISHNLLETEHKGHFSKTLIKNYYRYCQKENCFINHGIIGGLLLYDRLRKNYVRIQETALSENVQGAASHGFEYKGLGWAKLHEEYYAKTADTIIAHNIWYSTKENTKSIYKDYGLGKLIIPEQKKIEISGFKNKLIPLLILCDTIEPIKAFSQLDPRCVLQKINIAVSPASKSITITVLDDCLNYQGWFKKIKDIEEWLNVEVYSDGRDLVITLPTSAAMLAIQ